MGMLVSCLSNIMYLSEKLTLWLTCIGLISCLMITFAMSLGMGIGLGYNYCFVDLKTRYRHIPGHYVYPGNSRWPYTAKASFKSTDSDFPLDYENLTTANSNTTAAIEVTDNTTATEVVTEATGEAAINTEATVVTEARYIATIVTKATAAAVVDNKSETKAADADDIPPDISESDTVTDTVTDAVTDADVFVNRGTFQNQSSPFKPHLSLIGTYNNVPVYKTRGNIITIPLKGLDLIGLLSDLRAENRNFSVKIFKD